MNAQPDAALRTPLDLIDLETHADNGVPFEAIAAHPPQGRNLVDKSSEGLQ